MLGGAVADLMSACEGVDGGAVGTSVEHVPDVRCELNLEALRGTYVMGSG